MREVLFEIIESHSGERTMTRYAILIALAAGLAVAVAASSIPSKAATVNGLAPDSMRLTTGKENYLRLACDVACRARRAVEAAAEAKRAAERKDVERRMRRHRTPPMAGGVRG